MSGFFAKKSAPANVEEEQAAIIDDGAPLTDNVCRKHNNPGTMICDCKTEPICDLCMKDHQGIEHKKMFLKDISKAFPSLMNKKIEENNTFYKGYKSSLSGKYFQGYVEFFEDVIDSTH